MEHVERADPRLYAEFADWWPVLSAPHDYTEEAARYYRILSDDVEETVRTVLELGSGGGNNASHLKAHYAMTLVDRSEGMLEVSRALNPECIHHRGDMRDVRLGRTFDAVFIHDAIMYITTEADLRKTFETAAAHLSEGGALLVVPDWVRETFHPRTHFGGHDVGERSMRFVEWTVDPDPGDTTYQVDYVYLFREGTRAGDIRIERDRHIEGIFPRAAWIQLMDEAGFDARSIVEDDAEAFLGVRRAAESTG